MKVQYGVPKFESFANVLLMHENTKKSKKIMELNLEKSRAVFFNNNVFESGTRGTYCMHALTTERSSFHKLRWKLTTAFTLFSFSLLNR